MLHKDENTVDNWETIFSASSMSIRRFRMEGTSKLENLSTGDNEALVVDMMGEVTVSIKNAHSVNLGGKDVCYLPKGEDFTLSKHSERSEVVVAYAPAAVKYEVFAKRFSDIKPIESGRSPYLRKIYTMVGESDKANRFLGGFVEGDPGNWTSFPPHRHDGKPEAYLYYGMGEKFGVQMVLTERQDSSYVVRDGDAVLFEKGYHPNVAAPGTGMNFLWVISAPPERRDLSVEFHPAFEGMQAGATHLKTAPKKD